MRDALRLALQDARYANWDIKNLSLLLKARSAEIEIPRQPARRLQADTGICFASTTSRAEALKRLATDAGYPVDEP